MTTKLGGDRPQLTLHDGGLAKKPQGTVKWTRKRATSSDWLQPRVGFGARFPHPAVDPSDRLP